MDEKKTAWLNALALAVVLFAFLYAATPFFAKNTLWLDEATDAVIGQNLFLTGQLRNDDGTFVGRAPLNHFLLAVSYSLFGMNEFVLYACILALALVSLALVFILLRRLYGLFAATAAGLMLGLSSVFVFYSLRFLTEIPQVLAVAFSLFFFFLVFKERKFEFAPFLALGVFFALFAKPTLPVIFFPLALAVFLFYWKELFELFGNRKAVGVSIAVVVFFSFAVFSYNFAGTGSPIGLLSDYWTAVHEGQTVFPFEWYFSNAEGIFSGWFAVGLILLGAAYAAWNGDKPSLTIFLLFSISLLIMSFATIFKDYRYVMFVFPAAYALVGFAAATALKSVSLSIPKNEEDALKAVLAAFVIVALAASTVFNYSYVTTFTESRVSSYSEFKVAGAFVENITSSNETVFATGGPELGYYANRKALMFDYLNITNFLSELQKNNVRIIVVGIHEHGAEVVAASQKMQANQTQNPQNSFEYIFFNPNEFKPLQGFTSGQNTIMVVFERV